VIDCGVKVPGDPPYASRMTSFAVRLAAYSLPEASSPNEARPESVSPVPCGSGSDRSRASDRIAPSKKSAKT
jgi:hypothetical protein